MKIDILDEGLRLPKASRLTSGDITSWNTVMAYSSKHQSYGNTVKSIHLVSTEVDNFYPQIIGTVSLIRGKRGCVVNLAYATTYVMRDWTDEETGVTEERPTPRDYKLWETEPISSVKEANALFDAIASELFSIKISFTDVMKTASAVQSKFPAVAKKFGLTLYPEKVYWRKYEELT